ncbi:MAG TPA: hypothetical protein VND92_04405, partial [Vicinamibacterales bacterium]|nr:hypothetical protein [Vicinamibacterales bacterium]
MSDAERPAGARRRGTVAGPAGDATGSGPGATGSGSGAAGSVSGAAVEDSRSRAELTFRAESGRVLATLIRLLGGDFDAAEEALADA